MKDYKNILLINPFAVGDILSSTTLIRALRDKFPHSFIAYICPRRVESIVASNPKIDQVFVFEKDEYRNLWNVSKAKCMIKFLKFLRSIKKKKFDLAIDLSLGDRYSFFLKILGVHKRVGFNYKNRGRFQTYKLNIVGFEDKHVVEYYFDLLKFVGIDGPPGELEVFLKKEDEKWADEFLKSNNIKRNDLLIGIDPAGGESFGPWANIKRWPVEYFAELSDRLVNEFSAKIVILAGSKEKEVVNRMMFLMRNKPIDASRSSLMQLAAVIKRCNLIICNDTGPMRFANAFGEKVIALFGPTDEKIYGPYPFDPERHIVIKKDLPCRPCYKKFKLPECPYDRKCLKSISVDEVFEAAKRLINR